MRYRVGLMTAWNQPQFTASFDADSPFPAFAVGNFIQFQGQWLVINGVAHSLGQDASGTEWAITMLLVANPAQQMSMSSDLSLTH